MHDCIWSLILALTETQGSNYSCDLPILQMAKLKLNMEPGRDTAGCEPKLHHHPGPGSICRSVSTQPPPHRCQIHLRVQHLPFPGRTHPTLARPSLRPAQIHSMAPSGWKGPEPLSFPPRQRSIPSTGVKVGMKLLGWERRAFGGPWEGLALWIIRWLRAPGGAGVSQAAATRRMDLLRAWRVTGPNRDVLGLQNTPQHAETSYENENAGYQVNNLYIDCTLKWECQILGFVAVV